jgi:pilus assembly protein CpaB
MGRRTVLLLAAVLVAALGTGAVFAYVRGVDRRAIADQEPVQVLVATDVVRAGTTIADAQRSGAFKIREVPRSAVVDGALSELTTVADRVAGSDIYPGEQVLAGKLVSPGAVASLPIPAGRLAVSVQLGDPQRVAGFVAPGSEVAVFATATQAGTGGGNGAEITNLLLARVPVIAVGPTTISTAEGTQNKESLPTAILTLAVTQAEATRLIHAANTGRLYFGLLTRDSKVTAGSPVDTNAVLGGVR